LSHNSFETWPAPPWTGDQVNTLALCLEMALEAAGGG